MLARPERRAYVVEHHWTKSQLVVFNGTRTARTREDAEEHATSLCAALNALKIKRI